MDLTLGEKVWESKWCLVCEAGMVRSLLLLSPVFILSDPSRIEVNQIIQGWQAR
jgi:hypothetical protein